MERKIYDHQKLLAFRHHMHQNPELSFRQFNTRQNVKAFLKDVGVDPKTFKELAKTALIVDLHGTAEPKGDKRCVAFRADMDALSMCETNQHLPYRSTIPAAHMCGHDGHVTCLLAFVMRFLEVLDKIPSNKSIRLLFQPSEQGPHSGAQLMVKEGAMEGVDEVYGFHNWPTALAGELWVKEGPMMSSISILKITIIGTMGHGSEPQKVKDCVRAAAKVYEKINSYIDQIRKDNPQFVCTLPVFQAGSRYNVFGQKAVLEGTIRSYNLDLSRQVIAKIKEIVQQVQKDGFKQEFEVHGPLKMVNNSAKEADHVRRIGQKVYGKQKVGKGPLPVKASEDMGHFLDVRPGAFFFLSSAKIQNAPMVHSNNYDFNDDLIDKAGQFWLALALDRLQVN